MKIRSALLAICLGWILALAPIAIKQFSNLQPARWMSTQFEHQFGAAWPPAVRDATPALAVPALPSGQVASLQHATTNLPTATPSLTLIAKGKKSLAAPSIPTTAAAQESTRILTSTIASPQPTTQVVDRMSPTATPTTVFTPTATTSPTTIPTEVPTVTASPTATPLPNRADLQISQSAMPDPVQAGALLTYTIQIDNPGPGIARNVLIRDTLPNGLLFEGAASLRVRRGEEPELYLNNNQLTGSVSLLKVGGTITIVAPVRVRSSLELATLFNQVTISSTTPDDQLANNQATVSVAISGTISARLNSYLPVIYK